MGTLHALTGAVLDNLDDICQSVRTILTTPIGSRVMRRDFGSLLFDLVDSPATPIGAMRVIAASADAIERWEPRVRFLKASVVPAANGQAVVYTHCELREGLRPIEIPITIGAIQ